MITFNPQTTPDHLGKTANEHPKLMISKIEAAAALSVSLRTIDNLIANKQLIARRVGKRVLIPYASLLQFTKHDHPTGRIQ